MLAASSLRQQHCFPLKAPSSFQPGNELRCRLTGRHGDALRAETCPPKKKERERDKVNETIGPKRDEPCDVLNSHVAHAALCCIKTVVKPCIKEKVQIHFINLITGLKLWT